MCLIDWRVCWKNQNDCSKDRQEVLQTGWSPLNCTNMDGDQLICHNYSQKEFRDKAERDELAMNIPTTLLCEKGK